MNLLVFKSHCPILSTKSPVDRVPVREFYWATELVTRYYGTSLPAGVEADVSVPASGVSCAGVPPQAVRENASSSVSSSALIRFTISFLLSDYSIILRQWHTGFFPGLLAAEEPRHVFCQHPHVSDALFVSKNFFRAAAMYHIPVPGGNDRHMPPKEKLVQLVQRGSCTRTSGRYHRSRRFQIKSVLPGVQVSKKRPAHKCGQCSGGSGIVDRRAKEEAVIVPGNRQEIIDTMAM